MGFGGGLLVGVFGGGGEGPPLLLYAQGQLSFFAHVCAVLFVLTNRSKKDKKK